MATFNKDAFNKDTDGDSFNPDNYVDKKQFNSLIQRMSQALSRIGGGQGGGGGGNGSSLMPFVDGNFTLSSDTTGNITIQGGNFDPNTTFTLTQVG